MVNSQDLDSPAVVPTRFLSVRRPRPVSPSDDRRPATDLARQIDADLLERRISGHSSHMGWRYWLSRCLGRQIPDPQGGQLPKLHAAICRGPLHGQDVGLQLGTTSFLRSSWCQSGECRCYEFGRYVAGWRLSMPPVHRIDRDHIAETPVDCAQFASGRWYVFRRNYGTHPG